MTWTASLPPRMGLRRGCGRCWLPDEVILYFGKANVSLRDRVGAYYATRLGKRRPHAGGRFLKTLAVLDELWVHCACGDEDAEARMLGAFIGRVRGGEAVCACMTHRTLSRARTWSGGHATLRPGDVAGH